MSFPFFGDNVLLRSETAVKLYQSVRDLPIVDYHSHLSEGEIAADKTYSTITELWLKGDHYKWRAMRACGVDEKYITGDAGDYEKFLAYASVMPKLLGNPLYAWAHLELKRVFGIDLPLNRENAPAIYTRANEALKEISVRRLLKKFNVEYIATTDDPLSELSAHGVYDGIRVCPTFRPDRAFRLEREYLERLGALWGKPVRSLDDFNAALDARLSYFLSKGCTIADLSLECTPSAVGKEEAERIFSKGESATREERERFLSYELGVLGKCFKERGVTWQIHIGALRNVNSRMFAALGADAGYDVMKSGIDTDAIAAMLDRMDREGGLPSVVLYSLVPQAVPALCCIAECFPNVRVGAAWWFNDTLEGIRSHLSVLSEYGVLGTSLGMLTDSRSFSSYCRFEFFRRILSDFVAEKTEAGEYEEGCAKQLLYDICYANPKAFMKI